MSLPAISAERAKELLAKGAVLIDVREADEHAREHIPGALLSPLSAGPISATVAGPVVFHCKAGTRTLANASALAGASEGCEAYILEGGIEAWKAAGLPVTKNPGQPLEIMRQVQITAGSLAFLGTVLGFLVNPAFHLLSGFIGAGLLFAGISGWCGMARLLAVMPWNRPAAATRPAAV